MTLWNAEGLKPIGYLVWPLRSLKVRNPFLTLTWPGDLTFGDLGLKFSHKVWNSIVSRYWKNGGAARRRFSAIREKPEGRAFFAPPSSARVNVASSSEESQRFTPQTTAQSRAAAAAGIFRGISTRLWKGFPSLHSITDIPRSLRHMPTIECLLIFSHHVLT